MTDLPATARFALPLLATAQAQKEVTHNEALTLLDALVHAAIEDGPQADPPAERGEGQCWLVGAAATGDWAGQDDALALWTANGWRFLPPRAGMKLYRLANQNWLYFDGENWAEPPTVATPLGGTTVDSEARAAIDTLIVQLAAQGLLIYG